MSKILTVEEFIAVREKIRAEDKKLIHCHGVFDLLHPGHIAYFEEARQLGDVLVVSVTTARFVNKGPGRPYFSDELRARSLAALASIDYVIFSDAETAVNIIDLIKPDLYVKGQEYAVSENDVTGNIDVEIDRVRYWGGDVHFTGGVVFSSTQLLNRHFDVFSSQVKEFAQTFTRKHSLEDVRQVVEKMKSLKVLVVGDSIIDEYVMCQVQGLTSKDRAFSVRYDREEHYLGGALAVARHAANFAGQVVLSGILGDEPTLHTQILNELSNKMYLDLEFDSEFHTVVKRRYVERKGVRDEYEKMFSINFLGNESSTQESSRTRFYRKIEEKARECDLVIIADYGHCLVDEKVMDILQKGAKLLAVNCQTNSANYGTNLLTKYSRADFYTLDEKEIRLALADRSSGYETLAQRLHKHFSDSVGWLTLGSQGSLGIDRDGQMFHHPALTLNVRDTVGAGDAFYVLAALASAAGADLETASFLANIAGAMAANYLGNSRSVRREDVLKFAATIMKV